MAVPAQDATARPNRQISRGRRHVRHRTGRRHRRHRPHRGEGRRAGGHGAPAAERGRTNKSVGFSSRPYWLYLIPGGLLFVVVILGPLVYNVYLSLTKWSGVGQPKFIGFDNYVKLLSRQRLLGVVQELRRDDHRHGGDPDTDRPAAGLGAVRLPGQAFRRIQRQRAARGVLPAAGAAGRGGRHRLGLDPAAGRRVQRLPRRDRSAGLHPGLARRPEHRAADGHAGDGLGADRLPGGHFHVRAAAGRPGDLRGRGDRRRRLLGPVPGDHHPADQPGDLRGRADLHHRRAEGVRADLRPDPGRPGERHQRAVVLRLLHVLQEAQRRLRGGHRHRAHPDHRPGRRRHHAVAGELAKRRKQHEHPR